MKCRGCGDPIDVPAGFCLRCSLKSSAFQAERARKKGTRLERFAQLVAVGVEPEEAGQLARQEEIDA